MVLAISPGAGIEFNRAIQRKMVNKFLKIALEVKADSGDNARLTILKKYYPTLQAVQSEKGTASDLIDNMKLYCKSLENFTPLQFTDFVSTVGFPEMLRLRQQHLQELKSSIEDAKKALGNSLEEDASIPVMGEIIDTPIVAQKVFLTGMLVRKLALEKELAAYKEITVLEKELKILTRGIDWLNQLIVHYETVEVPVASV